MRLWIVLSVVYAIPIAFFAAADFPDRPGIERVRQALPEQQKHLVSINWDAAAEKFGGKLTDSADIDAAIKALPDTTKRPADDGPIDVSRVEWIEAIDLYGDIPAYVPEKSTQGEREALKQAWKRAYDEKLFEARARAVQASILIWATPCVALLLLGAASGLDTPWLSEIRGRMTTGADGLSRAAAVESRPHAIQQSHPLRALRARPHDPLFRIPRHLAHPVTRERGLFDTFCTALSLTPSPDGAQGQGGTIAAYRR